MLFLPGLWCLFVEGGKFVHGNRIPVLVPVFWTGNSWIGITGMQIIGNHFLVLIAGVLTHRPVMLVWEM